MIRKIKVPLLFVSLLCLCFFATGCPNGILGGIGGGIVPDKLIGKWSASNSSAYASSCIGTWTFTSTTVGYKEVCDNSIYNSSWERDVAKVWEDDDYLRTENDMYVAWHIVGNSIYVDKNNPNSSGPESTWNTDWWDSRSPFSKE